MYFGYLLSFLSILIIITFFLFILITIFIHGGKVISWSFLFQFPKNGMTEGGIFPAIIGTIYLTLGAIIIAFPIGVMSALYLNEYANNGFLTKIIRIAINNLASTPSVIFGLFGLALFVNLFHIGVSILSGIFTLSILVLPIIIRTTEESLKMVSNKYREAAYALGATKWQVIKDIVFPISLSGILTGAILSMGRIAGETAPIIFTAATFYKRNIPKSLLDDTMVLPYHIFALITEGVSQDKQTAIAYGASLILLILVLLFNIVAIIIRYKRRINE